MEINGVSFFRNKSHSSTAQMMHNILQVSCPIMSYPRSALKRHHFRRLELLTRATSLTAELKQSLLSGTVAVGELFGASCFDWMGDLPDECIMACPFLMIVTDFGKEIPMGSTFVRQHRHFSCEKKGVSQQLPSLSAAGRPKSSESQVGQALPRTATTLATPRKTRDHG